jgi:hypothetical protein
MRRPFLRRAVIFPFLRNGGVTAGIFIAFLKRLLTRAGRVIFLIADRGPAHIVRKTRAVAESLDG